MMLEGADYFIHCFPFDNLANSAMTVMNDDGTFDIYLNTLLDDSRLALALRHELWHIEHDDFYSEAPIDDIESFAKGAGAV